MAIFKEQQVSGAASQQVSLPFPVQTALAVLTAVVVLAVAQFWPQRGVRGLAPGVLAEAWQVRMPHRPMPVLAEAPVRDGVSATAASGAVAEAVSGTGLVQSPAAGVPGKPAQPGRAAQAGAAAPAGPLLQDNAGALGPFFEQLWTLEQKKQPAVVTVLHYGDSPTTADLITGDVRQILQERFGDAGHGFNLGAKPWAWYGHRNVEMKDSGWASSQKDATGVGRMKQALYGLGGATFAGSAGAETTYTLKDAASAPQTSVDVDYLAQPGGGTLTVSADGNTLATIDTNAKAALPAMRAVTLPAGAKQVKVACTAGAAKWFGVDFRRGDHGVVYDSLGLNGATTTVVSRTFDPAAWAEEMKAAKPSLIVINYGTNESQYAGLVGTLEAELRGAIAKAHAAAPGVPVLIMSPMDRGEHAGMTEIHSNAQIAKIVAIQQRVAADTHCAFFNTFAAMGGDGTMARWYAAHPRLVTADLIHPTPDGAVLVARLFVDNLYAGYDAWKQTHGIGVVRVMNATEAAAKKKDEAERKKAEAAKARAEAKSTAAEKKPKASRAATPKTSPATQDSPKQDKPKATAVTAPSPSAAP